MPGPVQERRQEHVAGRAGRRGSHICLHWQQQPGGLAPALLELQESDLLQPHEQSAALRAVHKPPCGQMGLYHCLGATLQKEQRIGVAYLLSALGFV